jgi:hypothetical protein
MKTQSLESWEEFEDQLTKIDKETKSLQESGSSLVSHPLFRGVSDSEYHLESTLDRLKKEETLPDYIQTIKVVNKHVETCTGKKWYLKKSINYVEFELPAYEFMTYLRHNGFPSPLTDWTRSPYIAAFFAFRDIFSKAEQKKHVSIFVYREFCGHGKGWIGSEPHIHLIGPTIATDPKHYLQQSEYLFCVKNKNLWGKKNNDNWVFANFEDVKEKDGQDILIKYDLPISEQEKVLRRLDVMNITAYSLFNSESSLMETLASREVFLRHKESNGI